MSVPDLVLLALIGLALVLAVRKVIRSRGSCSCGGDCSCCGDACGHRNNEKSSGDASPKP